MPADIALLSAHSRPWLMTIQLAYFNVPTLDLWLGIQAHPEAATTPCLCSAACLG